MVRGDLNALANNAFVVDAYVTRIDGQPLSLEDDA
jgi:hypothetical protein